MNAPPGVNALNEPYSYPNRTFERFPSDPKIVFTPGYHRLMELS